MERGAVPGCRPYRTKRRWLGLAMGAHTRARRRRGDMESVEENGAEVDLLLLAAGSGRRGGFALDGGGRRERPTALQR